MTDCLNFGSPEDPEVMWQFVEAIKGLVDGCRALGVPVTGGNVSFYNQTGGRNILPTPQVGMLGVIDDVRQRIPMGFAKPGDSVLLLGETKEELGVRPGRRPYTVISAACRRSPTWTPSRRSPR